MKRQGGSAPVEALASLIDWLPGNPALAAHRR